MSGLSKPASVSVSRSSLSARFLVSVSLVATAFVVPTGAVAAGSATGSATVGEAAARQQSAPVHLEARLRGGADGDPDGTGYAKFRLNRQRARVCADVTYAKIGPPDQAHIHRKSDGGVVVDLSGSVTGGPKCATGVSRKLIKRIVTYPRRYYFNVHNAEYPAGAIRGTLHR